MHTFLTLPIELREIIYGHLLVENFPIPIEHKYLGCRENLQALALVNKQAYADASSAYYSRNIFLIGSLNRHWTWNPSGTKRLTAFLRDVPPKNVALVRNVHFVICCTKAYTEPRGSEGPVFCLSISSSMGATRKRGLALVDDFIGLESITVDTICSYPPDPPTGCRRRGRVLAGTKAQNIDNMALELQILLRHPTVKTIIVRQHPEIELHEAVDRLKLVDRIFEVEVATSEKFVKEATDKPYEWSR